MANCSQKTACVDCKYMRLKVRANPFDPKDLGYPGILRKKIEWDNQQRELELLEHDRVRANEFFDFEPQFYPWCAKWTEEYEREGNYIIDRISGRQREGFMYFAFKKIKMVTALYLTPSECSEKKQFLR